METHKVAEDNQSKQNINDSYNFILLQTQLAFFHGCRSKQAILNSYSSEIFLPYNKSLITKLVQSRWQDIGWTLSLSWSMTSAVEAFVFIVDI